MGGSGRAVLLFNAGQLDRRSGWAEWNLRAPGIVGLVRCLERHGRAAHGQAFDQQRRLAHARRYALPALAAHARPCIETGIVAHHRDLCKVFRRLADQRHALQRHRHQMLAGDLAALADGLGHLIGLAQADAYPALGSILLWRAVVRTEEGWLVARVRPLGAG